LQRRGVEAGGGRAPRQRIDKSAWSRRRTIAFESSGLAAKWSASLRFCRGLRRGGACSKLSARSRCGRSRCASSRASSCGDLGDAALSFALHSRAGGPPGRRRRSLDRLDEAHVEHASGLVEDQHPDLGDNRCAAARCRSPSRRRDDDFHRRSRAEAAGGRACRRRSRCFLVEERAVFPAAAVIWPSPSSLVGGQHAVRAVVSVPALLNGRVASPAVPQHESGGLAGLPVSAVARRSRPSVDGGMRGLIRRRHACRGG